MADPAESYKATVEEKELIGVVSAKSKPGRDPEETRTRLKEIEGGVLGDIRDRERGWGERVKKFATYLNPTKDGAMPTKKGDFIVRIKEVASTNAVVMLSQMSDLEESTDARLRKLSMKTAEKFANITSQIRVANDAIHAADEYHEMIKEEQAERARMIKFLRAQDLRDHPLAGNIPLIRRFVLIDEKLPNAAGIKEDKLLKEAAKEVARDAKIEKKAYEREAKEQFSDVKGSEDALRTQILRYAPDAIDRLEMELRAAAAGDDGRLLSTIQGLDLGHYPEEQADNIRELLGHAVEVLSRKTAGQAKAYELIQKLEANDQTPENVAKALTRLPIGTPVTMEWDKTREKMVILAKQPEGRIVLKTLGSDDPEDNIILIPEQGIGLRAEPAPKGKASKSKGGVGVVSTTPGETDYVEEVFNISDTKITINTPRYI